MLDDKEYEQYKEIIQEELNIMAYLKKSPEELINIIRFGNNLEAYCALWAISKMRYKNTLKELEMLRKRMSYGSPMLWDFTTNVVHSLK